MNEPPPPETSLGGVPPQFRGHPLLSAGPFYTLPKGLLDRIVVRVEGDRFDDELLEMEHALSNACGDHSWQIGFRGEQPINFGLLRPKDTAADDFLTQGMARWGKSKGEARTILSQTGQRLDWTANIRRGYCGWLMTNRAFLEEHRQIFQDWASQVAEHGIPNIGPVVRDGRAIPGAQVAKGNRGRFIQDFEQFFIRWRLEGMPAPLVPQPMGVHLPVVDLRPVLGHMRQGGTTFYIPDICPVPSRDELRGILEEALRDSSTPDHLTEWIEIVHSDNVAKNRIPRYARVFEVQHYMRALYARHAGALKRKKSSLIVAFAEYLGTSDDTIEIDLRFIADRLGTDWCLAST